MFGFTFKLTKIDFGVVGYNWTYLTVFEQK